MSRNEGFLRGLKNNSDRATDRYGSLKIRQKEKKGVFRQVSTVDFSEIFKSTKGWSNPSSGGSIDIDETFGLLRFQNNSATNATLTTTFDFQDPIKVNNRAGYLRLWLNNDNPAGTTRIFVDIHTGTVGGPSMRLRLDSTNALHGNNHYIDLGLDRAILQGSGGADITNGIARITVFLQNKNGEEVNLTIGKLEFIRRKPFIQLHIDAPRLEAMDDFAPLLVTKNLPFSISLQPQDFEKYNNNPESDGDGRAKLSDVLDYVNNYQMFTSYHIPANRFPVSPVITQSGDGTTAEITQIKFYQTRSSIGRSNEDLLGGNYFLISSPSTDYYVWFNTGSDADPTVSGRTGVQVDISAISDDSPTPYAQAASDAINALTDFTSSQSEDVITITNVNNGVVTAPDNGTCPFGEVGFTQTLRRMADLGKKSGVLKNGYVFNAFNNNNAISTDYDRIAKSYSVLCRANFDTDFNTSWKQNPVFAPKSQRVTALRYSYMNQSQSPQFIYASNLDSEFTYDEIVDIFTDIIQNQVFYSFYSHGSDRLGKEFSTSFNTIYNFFRAVSDYAPEIDVLSPKEVYEMFSEVEPIISSEVTSGKDTTIPPTAYRIPNEDDILV